jgi:acyl-CoA thioester hydrolase
VVVVPVQWGDQDAFGHVNNTVYFRWFESARIEYARRVGLPVVPPGRGIGPVLAAISCDFRRQMTHPDTIHVGARITRIGRSSLTMEHLLLSAAGQAIAAESSSTLVVFDYGQQRAHPVPDPVRAAIEQLEGKSFPRP